MIFSNSAGSALAAAIAAPFFAPMALAEDDPATHALAVLEPLTGHVWIGTPTDSAMTHTDIARWETVIDGVAIQSTHSINHGVYGGTTLFYYDQVAERLSFTYATNAGFHSTGYLTPADDGALDVFETIHGNSDVAEVRARILITPTGYQTRSLYLVDGEWREGDGHDYVPAPSGTSVRFNGAAD
jgi:hypothetical protein